MKEFFGFRKMVSPLIVKLIYGVGLVGLTIAGIVMMFQGGEAKSVAIGLGVITLGNLAWRLICEGMILAFSIQEILASIEQNTKK